MSSRSLFLMTLFLGATLAQSQETPEQPARPVYQSRGEEEIESTLQHVLSASEYRRLSRKQQEKETKETALPNWLERLIDWLAERFSSRPSDEERGDIVLPNLDWIRWIVYALVIVVLIWVITLIVKAIIARVSSKEPIETLRTASPSEEVASTPPGEHPSQEYLQRALGFAEAGDYKAAIRQLLLGTMSWIERHDLIRYRRGLSNRDYLRAVGARPPVLEPLSRIVLHFERVYFGRREASQQGFQECLQHFRKAFEAE